MRRDAPAIPVEKGRPGHRYVIGRDGVFATLWDRHERRMVVENASEEQCRRIRNGLLRGV